MSMPRTAIYGRVHRALGRAHAVNVSGMDVEELADSLSKRADDGITRRRFVGLAAVGTAGLFAGCATGRGAGRSGDPVVIVGAGIAGLTAAYRLRQAGVPVRVFDAQNRVGGRMLSLRDFFADGQVCELGGELIDTPHATIRGLATEFGIALDDLSREPAGMAMETLHFGGRDRGDAELIEAFRPVAARMAADRNGVGDDPTAAEPAGAVALDGISIEAWLDRAGVSGWVRDLLRVAYTTEYGMEIGEQSALNLLLMIESDPFRIFGESDERFHVHEGNDRITSALASRLGDAIETTSVLEAISVRADGRYVCTFARSTGTFEVDAADVVLAIPFTLLREVRIDVELPTLKRRAIDELGYGTNAKLMIGFAGRVWRERHGSNGSAFSDLPFQLVWETSRGQSGASGILTNFTGGQHGIEIGTGTASARAAEVVLDLERIYPGIASDRTGMREVRMHWPSHPWTRGSYSGYRVGQWTAFRGIEGQRVGRLYFAGEHCSLGAQGFMEGGCETGQRAAV
jgi:monoamine oxidase